MSAGFVNKAQAGVEGREEVGGRETAVTLVTHIPDSERSDVSDAALRRGFVIIREISKGPVRGISDLAAGKKDRQLSFVCTLEKEWQMGRKEK